MMIVGATCAAAYALSELRLDKCWFDLCADKMLKRQQSFLGARTLLLMLLKARYGIEKLPQITASEHGKPFFADYPKLHFNISNSAGFLVVALSEHRVGVDLEFVKKRHNLAALIERTAGLEEQGYLKSLSSERCLNEFTALWTVREAVLKAVGTGLTGLEALKLNPVTRVAEYAAKLEGKVGCIKPENFSVHSDVAYLSWCELDDEPRKPSSANEAELPEFFEIKAGELCKIKAPADAVFYRLRPA